MHLTNKELENICLQLLKDYDVDPTSWTLMEINNLVNLLNCYVDTKNIPQ
jgi:hypothetical protein